MGLRAREQNPMSAKQVGVNAAASRWLAERLELWGLADGSAQERAEWVVAQLLEQGLAPTRPAPPPVSLRPDQLADPDHRKDCKARIDQALAAARARRQADLGYGERS